MSLGPIEILVILLTLGSTLAVPILLFLGLHRLFQLIKDLRQPGLDEPHRDDLYRRTDDVSQPTSDRDRAEGTSPATWKR